MKVLQSITLLDGVSRNCRQALKWSPFEDKCAILLKSGIYILTLNPVPSNLSTCLNTVPKYLPYEECGNDEDPAIGVQWLPSDRILTRTISGVTYITDISSIQRHKMKCKSSVSAILDQWLFLADFNKTIHAFKEDDTEIFSEVCSFALEENISDILPLKFGEDVLILVSLVNGLVTMLKLDADKINPLNQLVRLAISVYFSNSRKVARKPCFIICN